MGNSYSRTSRTSRSPVSAVGKLTEIGIAAPQVIAHRVARMALSGPVPNARDRQEFTAMVVEKQIAFAQAWMQMGLQMMKAQQSLWQTALHNPADLPAALPKQMERVTAQTVEPVRRKAVANAKRLAGTRLR